MNETQRNVPKWRYLTDRMKRNVTLTFTVNENSRSTCTFVPNTTKILLPHLFANLQQLASLVSLYQMCKSTQFPTATHVKQVEALSCSTNTTFQAVCYFLSHHSGPTNLFLPKSEIHFQISLKIFQNTSTDTDNR